MFDAGRTHPSFETFRVLRVSIFHESMGQKDQIRSSGETLIRAQGLQVSRTDIFSGDRHFEILKRLERTPP